MKITYLLFLMTCGAVFLPARGWADTHDQASTSDSAGNPQAGAQQAPSQGAGDHSDRKDKPQGTSASNQDKNSGASGKPASVAKTNPKPKAGHAQSQAKTPTSREPEVASGKSQEKGELAAPTPAAPAAKSPGATTASNFHPNVPAATPNRYPGNGPVLSDVRHRGPNPPVVGGLSNGGLARQHVNSTGAISGTGMNHKP
jgi:hypothetical protein